MVPLTSIRILSTGLDFRVSVVLKIGLPVSLDPGVASTSHSISAAAPVCASDPWKANSLTYHHFEQ